MNFIWGLSFSFLHVFVWERENKTCFYEKIHKSRETKYFFKKNFKQIHPINIKSEHLLLATHFHCYLKSLKHLNRDLSLVFVCLQLREYTPTFMQILCFYVSLLLLFKKFKCEKRIECEVSRSLWFFYGFFMLRQANIFFQKNENFLTFHLWIFNQSSYVFTHKHTPINVLFQFPSTKINHSPPLTS